MTDLDEFETDMAKIGNKLRDFCHEHLLGTDFAPEDGIVMDAALVIGWMRPDGRYGTAHVRAGTPWAQEGLMTNALREMETISKTTLTHSVLMSDYNDGEEGLG